MLLGCYKLWEWSWETDRHNERNKSFAELLKQQTDQRKAAQQEVRELKTKLREANTNSRYSAADLEAKKLAEQLDTNFEMGLVDAEAKMRLERDGPNSLTPPKKTPEWLK